MENVFAHIQSMERLLQGAGIDTVQGRILINTNMSAGGWQVVAHIGDAHMVAVLETLVQPDGSEDPNVVVSHLGPFSAEQPPMAIIETVLDKDEVLMVRCVTTAARARVMVPTAWARLEQLDNDPTDPDTRPF